MVNIIEPTIIKDLFSHEDYSNLRNLFDDNVYSFERQESLGRYVIADNSMSELKLYTEKILPKAREIFNSQTLLPTYTLFAHYDKNANLYFHKDDNACSYTIDMCIYQKAPWDIWVEGKPYTLYPNEGLAFNGNDQLHGRKDFPNIENNYVAMIFFHFVEPDHWYFTKGPSYLSVIRGEIYEKDWVQA